MNCTGCYILCTVPIFSKLNRELKHIFKRIILDFIILGHNMLSSLCKLDHISYNALYCNQMVESFAGCTTGFLKYCQGRNSERQSSKVHRWKRSRTLKVTETTGVHLYFNPASQHSHLRSFPKMPTPRSHSKATESESLGLGLGIEIIPKLPSWP